MPIIGIVAEGLTDQVVLRALLHKNFLQTHPEVEITFVDLQPSFDRTSGSREGGWEMVYKWCLNNPPELRVSQFFGKGLFGELSATVVDAIIVHMDADICDKIGSKSDVGPKPGAGDPPDVRGSFVEAVVSGWLWSDEVRPDGRHIVAPAVESVETWLVAGLRNKPGGENVEIPGDLEAAKNIAELLVKLDFYLSGRTPPATAKRIRKTKTRYEKVSHLAASNINDVKNSCTWFKKLIHRVEPFVKPIAVGPAPSQQDLFSPSP